MYIRTVLKLQNCKIIKKQEIYTYSYESAKLFSRKTVKRKDEERDSYSYCENVDKHPAKKNKNMCVINTRIFS